MLEYYSRELSYTLSHPTLTTLQMIKLRIPGICLISRAVNYNPGSVTFDSFHINNCQKSKAVLCTIMPKAYFRHLWNFFLVFGLIKMGLGEEILNVFSWDESSAAGLRRKQPNQDEMKNDSSIKWCSRPRRVKVALLSHFQGTIGSKWFS